MLTSVIIPFRDRGGDPLRQANLDRVVNQWRSWSSSVSIVDDGLEGDAPFNRSAAYNRGARLTFNEVVIFAESDMLLNLNQVARAVRMAIDAPGLVVPFTQYRYLSEVDSHRVRKGADPAPIRPLDTMEDGRSIGAINVVSRRTLSLVGGYDECFAGSWYDDRAMHRAFDICAGPTRWVNGPAYHLYHLPGWRGVHLSAEDRKATRMNKARYYRYLGAESPEAIRELVLEGRSDPKN